MSQVVTNFSMLQLGKVNRVFKAGTNDIVLTLELKNTNDHQVKFDAVLTDGDNVKVGEAVKVTVEANRSYKKFNVLVKANNVLSLNVTTEGIAVRVYQPALYIKPGQITLLKGNSEVIKVHLDKDSNETIVVENKIAGITVSPMQATVIDGTPAEFTITRSADSVNQGQVLFKIGSLKLATVLDVGFDDGIIDDGDGNGDTEESFNADLVASYLVGRDHLTK